MMRRLMALALLWLAAGCGFHLAGSDLHSEIERAYVRAAPSVTLAAAVSRSLRQSGVTVLEAQEPQVVTIELLSQREERRTVTTTPQAQAADYGLNLEVVYRVVGADGTDMVPERTASVTRVVPVDRSNLVGSREQETIVHGEMERELVRQILQSVAIASRGQKP
jgi:outer membrane lipopolysaccharide assembly protein LptE/RlpB